MSREALMKNLENWHDNNEFQKIIDALEEIPPQERDYELTGLLARAYSNLGQIGETEPFEKSIQLLLSTKEEGRQDPNWFFRMAYSLYYLNREAEAIPCLEKVLSLIPQDLETQIFWFDAKMLLRSCQQEAAAKGEYQYPDNPDVLRFDNTAFKLMVVQNLMYEQELLAPKFDLSVFASHYLQRNINWEEEGWDVIPEALNWFYLLEIPSSLAPAVTQLRMEGDDEVYRQIFPFWSGRRVFDVDKISEEELAQFPNLKKITLSTSYPETLLPWLEQHGVQADVWHIRSAPCK